MKIELDSLADSLNKVRAYEPGEINIAGNNYVRSLLVSPDSIVSDWPPLKFSDLQINDFEQILTLAPEIVILGTGKTLTFPDPSLINPITEAGIGIEVMDTGAACRSYNFLLGEGRHVVAALLMIQD
ncbi:MAG: hypothetical protein GKR93_06080 [Gammaproteobacteria bacterium]|nr:hypothetical protein [Gammaproteobacteria bacterium]